MSEACTSSLGDRVPCGSRSGPRWFCAWTHPQEESRASRELARQDFRAFLPLLIEQRSRLPGVMFPRYLFVSFDPAVDRWGSIRSTRGVGGLICHGEGRPTPLPRNFVEGLIARTSDRGVVDDVPELDELIAPGTRLRLTAGPKAGDEELTGICQWSTTKRVRLLIAMLGREVPVTVDRTAVEAA